MKSAFLLFVALTAPAAPLSPEQELTTFHLADPDLRVELVACEPDVLSPVAMFVAEMIDYPLGPKGGQIRCLEDRNSDGRFETATVFAADLPFPSGVLPWRDGLLVTAAPDILFLRDTSGDRKSDEGGVLFRGFTEGNQQLRVNGLFFGLDNWIYGANGRSDGEVRKFPDGKPISLRGHDFRFRPDTGEFETLAGRSQFGVAHDDWGNRFLSWNTIAMRHEVIPKRYLLRNPAFSGTEGVFDISPEGDAGEVFPLTPAPLTFNNESTSHFNALAGLTIFRGDALGLQYYGNAFMGESLRNLVHRRVLAQEGPTFVARRADAAKEFLASSDPWFHPVNFATGPDGALYVVDFYRQFVEHPHYVPEKLRASQAWRTGAEHGRIWRVARKDRPRSRKLPGLEGAKATELVGALNDSNGWRRDTAHRLLIERKPPEAIPLLRNALTNSSFAALHAFWILEELGALDLPKALRTESPAVRFHALRLAERRDPSGVLNFDSGGDSRLALQLILSLGEIEDEAALDRLRELALAYSGERWHRLALVSSVADRPLGFLQRLANSQFLQAPTDGQKRFLQQLAPLLMKDGPSAVQFVRDLTNASDLARLALVRGFSGSQRLTNLAPAAERIADDATASTLDRTIAVQSVRHTSSKPGETLLRALETDQLRTVAAEEIATTPSALRDALRSWRRLAPRGRQVLLSKAVRSSPVVILEALEREWVRPVEIDPAGRDTLRKSPELKARAEKLFSISTDRQAVVQQFAPALELPGNAQKGSAAFNAKCGICHAPQAGGPNVGPDLSGASSRPKEALLVDILDPSRQVAPDFAAYTGVLADGDVVSGLVIADNESSITFRQPNAADAVVPRKDIRELRAEGRSLMPDGLEEGMTPQDVADLLAFLSSRAR